MLANGRLKYVMHMSIYRQLTAPSALGRDGPLYLCVSLPVSGPTCCLVSLSQRCGAARCERAGLMSGTGSGLSVAAGNCCWELLAAICRQATAKSNPLPLRLLRRFWGSSIAEVHMSRRSAFSNPQVFALPSPSPTELPCTSTSLLSTLSLNLSLLFSSFLSLVLSPEIQAP